MSDHTIKTEVGELPCSLAVAAEWEKREEYIRELLTDDSAERREVDWGAVKRAAHDWAHSAACAAAKRGGPWAKHKRAVAARNAAKARFLAIVEAEKER